VGGLLPSGTFPLERVRYFEKWNGHFNEHFIFFYPMIPITSWYPLGITRNREKRFLLVPRYLPSGGITLLVKDLEKFASPLGEHLILIRISLLEKQRDLTPIP
jgi:hypothetical protein